MSRSFLYCRLTTFLLEKKVWMCHGTQIPSSISQRAWVCITLIRKVCINVYNTTNTTNRRAPLLPSPQIQGSVSVVRVYQLSACAYLLVLLVLNHKEAMGRQSGCCKAQIICHGTCCHICVKANPVLPYATIVIPSPCTTCMTQSVLCLEDKEPTTRSHPIACHLI